MKRLNLEYISDRKDAAYNVLSDWVWKSTAVGAAFVAGFGFCFWVLYYFELLKK